MSWRGLSNRLTSPTSVTNVTATIRSTPRKVRSARTTGANDQAGNELLDGALQPFNPLFGDAYGFNHFLERNLVRRVIERLFLQPAQIAHRPAFLARIDAAVLEHESAHLLAMDPQHLDRCRPCADEIPHRLVACIGNPHRSKLAGAQKPGERESVPGGSSSPGRQASLGSATGRRPCIHARETDEPIEPIACRSGLIAKMQSIKSVGDPLNGPAHACDTSVDFSEEANFSLTARIGNRDGVSQFGNIDSDKCFSIICHGSSSCDEDRLSPSEQPSNVQCRASHLTGRNGHTVLRQEMAANGIRVTSICPGMVETELFNTITDERVLAIIEQGFDFEPLQPSAIADAVLYAMNQLSLGT